MPVVSTTPRTSFRIGGINRARHRATRSVRKATFGLASVLSIFALLAGGLVFTTPALALDQDASIQISKTVVGETGVPIYTQGATFSYALSVSCSSIQTGVCLAGTITDSVPAPLEVVSVVLPGTPASDYVNRSSGNDVEIEFIQSTQDNNVGLLDGESDTIILIEVKIPSTVSGDFAGTITNTAFATALNSPDDDDSADIALNVTQNLDVAASKSATPGETMPATPGQPVSFTIGGANASNYSVDSLTLTDPADGSSNLEYLDFTGISSITPPAGADRMLFEWQDALGDWYSVGTVAAIPANPADLLDGLDLAAIAGTRFTFSKAGGKVPSTPVGGQAVIGLDYVTSGAVTGLLASELVTITNVVDATVADGSATVSKQAPATVSVRNTPPSVEVTKVFLRTRLLPGESTEAILRAESTGKPITTMTISEPGASGLTLAEQGLDFDGFVLADLDWPAGANSAEITYSYADGSPSGPLSTTVRDTLPTALAGKAVTGFTVTFTGDMAAFDYAVIPFKVVAQSLAGALDVASTNTVDTTVTDSDGQTAEASATADITRQAKRVRTSIEKNIAKGSVWAAPGSNSLVSIRGTVTANDGTPEGSTIGSEVLVVSDPAGPADPAQPSEFWNNFDLRAITSVDVPTNATMTPEYWDGANWKPLPGVSLPIPGGTAGWNYTPDSALRASIQGIRFTFQPAVSGDLLEPGFNVLPYFTVALRDQLRDASGSTHDATEPVTVVNQSSSTVRNDTAIPPTSVTVLDDDAIVLIPVPTDPDPGPGSLNFVDKEWLNPTIVAQTDGLVTTRLRWGTSDLPLDRLMVSDPATSPTSANVASSVFDAFNVSSIKPMTDGWLKFDQVVAERYSETATDWVELSVCTSATPCAGSFPGYTFTPAERLDTLGVRFTFEERPDRASVITNPNADPEVGSGVASSGIVRPIDLVMQLRATLRSNPSEAVLGTTHGQNYNMDAETFGMVNNTVRGTGENALRSYTSTAEDAITILDTPLNVTLTKRFVDYNENLPGFAGQPTADVVGLPQVGTELDRYPVVTALLSAENTTQSKVDGISVFDPDPRVGSVENFYEDFNMHRIVSITQPAGVGVNTTVTLTREGPTSTVYTIAEAQALTPAELATVIAIKVAHNGRVNANSTTDIRIEYQLRAQKRGSSDPVVYTTDPLINTAYTELDSPAGTTGNVQFDDAEAEMRVVAPSFGATTTKTLSPAERFEDQARTGYTVSVTGKPEGSVRTTHLQLDDTSSTFWNAYDFAGFQNIVLPRPVEMVRASVLVGTSLSLNGGGTLDVTCAGNPILDACWQPGGWVLPASGTTVTAAQLNNSFSPAISLSQVRGVRFEFQRNAQANWERPSNPTVSAQFSVSRRSTLLVGSDGGATTLIPSTRAGTVPAPGETVAGTTSNTVNLTSAGLWDNGPDSSWTASADASASTVLKHRVNAISVDKRHGRENPGSPDTIFGTFLPGQVVPYTMTIKNTGAWAMTGLSLVDQITADGSGSLLVEPEADVEPGQPVPSPYAFSLKNSVGATLATTGFTATLNVTTGALVIGVPTGFVFSPGDTLKITANLTVRALPLVVPGTPVSNSIVAASDRTFERCDFTRNGASRPMTPNVNDCASDTTFTPAASSPLRVTKAVKGVQAGLGARDDLGVIALNVPVATCDAPNAGGGYYTTPCVPITEPGGLESWRVQLRNAGNIPASAVATIDVFPAFGDQGITVVGARGSLWAPTFRGELEPDLSGMQDAALASVTAYYSTTTPGQSCNAADIIATSGTLAPTDPCYTEVTVNRPGNLWKPYTNSLSDTVLASIKAIKLEVKFPGGGALQPGETIGFTYSSQTAWYSERPEAPVRGQDPIAWNLVAAGSVGTNGGASIQSTVTQPRRVGVAMASGELEFGKLVTDFKSSWGATPPTGYPFTLQCTSGGVDVPLRAADGTARNQFILAADGTVLSYNNGGTGAYGNVSLPLNAECSIAESPAGAGVEVSYSDSSVTAHRNISGVNIANPAFTGTTPVERITATNRYLPAGFSVSKAVDGSGAIDQSGTAITYPGPFGFNASCTFLGSEVLNQDFTLSPGARRTFTDLPADASCTVRETSTRGAASISSSLTQGSGTPVNTPGIANTFTLTPDSDGAFTSELAVLNTFAVGAASITKAFLGNGAGEWGNEDFEVRLRCTLPGAVPSVVFDDTHTLNKGDSLWAVGNLASGASCTVTEPATGGANSNVITPATFTVGSNDMVPSAVTVTNTFTTGTLRVNKALAGAPAASLSGALEAEYTVSLACTRQVDGATMPVVIPGGAERIITGNGYATYAGLPTGAECAVTETDMRFAQKSSLSPTGGLVTIGQNDTVAVTVTNTFENGSIAVSKTVTGEGAAFAPSSFDATLSCTWQGDTVPLANDGAITLRDGEITTITGVPLGSACALDESDSGQTSWTASPASVTVGEDSAATIAVENVYELASLRVQKAVIAGDGVVTTPTGFQFSAVCTFGGTEVLPLTTFSLNAGEFREFTGLPARADCSVTETDARGATNTVTTVAVEDATVAPVIDQASSSVQIPELSPGNRTGDAAENLVSYTNYFNQSGLIISKALEGAVSGVGLDRSFDIVVLCTLEGEQPYSSTVTLNADNGWTADLGRFVEGTECVVTEPELNGADAVVITPNDGADPTVGVVTIPDAGVVEVVVSNWFLSGSLEVTKTFAGAAAEKFGTADYTVTLACSLDGETVEIADGAERVLNAGSPVAQYELLPSGADCVLSETDNGGAGASSILDADGGVLSDDASDGHAFTVVVDASILNLDDQPQPALTVQNVFNFASVAVTKTVSTTVLDAAGNAKDHGTFTVMLTCTLDGRDVSALEPSERTIRGGETLGWTELPEGALCELEETDVRGAHSTTITVDGTTPVLGRTVQLGPLPADEIVQAGDDGEETSITATEVLIVNEFAALPPTLSTTGTNAALPIGLSALALGLGGLLFAFARRRRGHPGRG